MASLISGSTGSLTSSGSSSGTNEDCVINEGHFSSSCSSLELEDIQEAIEGVRRTILETEERSDARKELVHRLIRLRIKREDLEHRRFFLHPGQLEERGHCLVPAEPGLASARPAYCQECGGAAWPLLQTVYSCRTCGHTVHGSCLVNIRRPCVGAFLNRLPGEDVDEGFYDGNLSLAICPELSLAEQGYQCAECQINLTPTQARVCDYTGQSYCPNCHWGVTSPSPARILSNWDFTPQPMAQASLQYLALLMRRPLVNLQRVAPGLAAVSEEVSSVAGQRHELMAMKKYLTVCRIAQEDRLLTKLKDRQHFVEGADMYSFQDLLDIHSGVLATYLTSIINTFRDHIFSCVLCIAKSFLCEVCNSSDTLFPFSPMVEECAVCEAVFHRDCFRSVTLCPRCARREERQAVEREN